MDCLTHKSATVCNLLLQMSVEIVASVLQIAVRAVESEQTKLDRVMALVGFLHQHFNAVTDQKVKKVMLDGLEMRWADYDQPALLMAYMLNPQRKTNFLNPQCQFASVRNALQLVESLYLRLIPNAQADSPIMDQFLAYMNREGIFDEG